MRRLAQSLHRPSSAPPPFASSVCVERGSMCQQRFDGDRTILARLLARVVSCRNGLPRAVTALDNTRGVLLMRKLIAGMQSSIDAKIAGAEGFADWVETWS